MVDESVIREKLEKGYLRINTVIEIVGTPKGHVEDTLRMVLKQLREEKGVVELAHFKLAPIDIAHLFNDLLGRLHEIDMRLKNTNAANILLDKNLYNLLKNADLLVICSGQRTLGDISVRVS